MNPHFRDIKYHNTLELDIHLHQIDGVHLAKGRHKHMYVISTKEHFISINSVKVKGKRNIPNKLVIINSVISLVHRRPAKEGYKENRIVIIIPSWLANLPFPERYLSINVLQYWITRDNPGVSSGALFFARNIFLHIIKEKFHISIWTLFKLFIWWLYFCRTTWALIVYFYARLCAVAVWY